MNKISIAVALGLITTACAKQRPTTPSPVLADWRAVATPADRARLYGWRDAFVRGLNAATIGGNAGKIATEGALLQPDSALEGANLPSGRYRCRTIKLGAQASGPTYLAYPAFDCAVADEGEVASFAKRTGSQRPVGLIFDDGARRKIFLGTLMLGDEKTAIEYGRDPDRDMVGTVERIDKARWRLILPKPRFESVIDVIELVPAI